MITNPDNDNQDEALKPSHHLALGTSAQLSKKDKANKNHNSSQS